MQFTTALSICHHTCTILRFPNAFRISGMKHDTDNTLHNALKKLPGYLGTTCGPLKHSFMTPGTWHGTTCQHGVQYHSICPSPRWSDFLQDLRTMERLLNHTTVREQFAHRCVEKQGGPAADVKALNTWSCSLKSLRWEAIANFTTAALWQT